MAIFKLLLVVGFVHASFIILVKCQPDLDNNDISTEARNPDSPIPQDHPAQATDSNEIETVSETRLASTTSEDQNRPMPYRETQLGMLIIVLSFTLPYILLFFLSVSLLAIIIF